MRTFKLTIERLLVFSIGFLVMNAYSQDKQISFLKPSSVLREGVGSRLTSAQKQEILPWAKKSNDSLYNIIELTQDYSPSEAAPILRTEVQGILDNSRNKRTELLMRYVLDRGMYLLELIDSEVDSKSVGVVDDQVRVLRRTIELATHYYQSDKKVLEGNPEDIINQPFAEFGIDYSDFVMKLSQNILDASAQFKVAAWALGVLQMDLSRDTERATQVAYEIDFISKFIETLEGLYTSGAIKTDSDYLFWTRKIKERYEMVIKSLYKSIQDLNYDVLETSGVISTSSVSLEGARLFPCGGENADLMKQISDCKGVNGAYSSVNGWTLVRYPTPGEAYYPHHELWFNRSRGYFFAKMLAKTTYLDARRVCSSFVDNYINGGLFSSDLRNTQWDSEVPNLKAFEMIDRDGAKSLGFLAKNLPVWTSSGDGESSSRWVLDFSEERATRSLKSPDEEAYLTCIIYNPNKLKFN